MGRHIFKLLSARLAPFEHMFLRGWIPTSTILSYKGMVYESFEINIPYHAFQRTTNFKSH